MKTRRRVFAFALALLLLFSTALTGAAAANDTEWGRVDPARAVIVEDLMTRTDAIREHMRSTGITQLYIGAPTDMELSEGVNSEFDEGIAVSRAQQCTSCWAMNSFYVSYSYEEWTITENLQCPYNIYGCYKGWRMRVLEHFQVSCRNCGYSYWDTMTRQTANGCDTHSI